MTRGLLYYLMIPLLLAAALFQSATFPRLSVAGVKPDAVLLLVMVGTLLYGGRVGVLWAFAGGIALDLFSGGPMGSSSLALMAAALVASLGYRTLSRFNLFVSLGVCAFGTLTYALVYMGILGGLNALGLWASSLPLVPTLERVVVPAVVYNTALMLAALPLLNRVPNISQV
jgi:rod shape-determining protein MreD